MELNDYQKGTIDTIVGIFEMMLSEMDNEMITIVLERLRFEKKKS